MLCPSRNALLAGGSFNGHVYGPRSVLALESDTPYKYDILF